MSFFGDQDKARQNTQQLIALFGLSVLCMIVTIYVAALAIFGAMSGLLPHRSIASAGWQPQLFGWVAVLTILLIGCGSWYKLLRLQQGGWVIAQDLGGRRLIAETADAAERQLLNVVEEMAIAAGTPVPAVYVLDREYGINAFAAGYSPGDAVIGVTRGTLEQLDRDELQGVIGHEFSHILNGDMRLNLRLVGLLHGILLIYIVGRVLLRWNVGFDSRDGKKHALIWFGLALIAIGSVGMLCGRLIKSAISRQREFLADASAVQFTRNPSGIAAALGKISQHSSLVHSPYAEANSHLFFGSALRFDWFGNLFATHPPLNQRVRRLDAYKGQYAAATPATSAVQAGDDRILGFAAGRYCAATLAGSSSPPNTGSFTGWAVQLPPSVQAELQAHQGAIAVVYALMLAADSRHEPQIGYLHQTESSEVAETAIALYPDIQAIELRLRLPLLDLAIAALSDRSIAQHQQLCQGVSGMAKVDGRWSMSKFVLYLILWHRLLNSNAVKDVKYTTLDLIWSDCLIVLSALAQVGETRPEAIDNAFRVGLYRLPGTGQRQRPEAPPACNLTALKKSLDRLSLAAPKLKQSIVDACAYLVLDNSSSQKADLLRAIAIVLGCPLPAFLQPIDRPQPAKAISHQNK